MWEENAGLRLNHSFKLAGQVISLDVWRGYIAVGSSVVQLIHLNSQGEPKRILYTKANDPLQVAAKLYSVV